MVNLNNIFNKFFPKSQTSPTGKKLIYMAWAIEITVALVGFTMAYLFIMQSETNVSAITNEDLSGTNLENIIIGLAFFIVGIMELTKIPLATAWYYSVRTFWKITFFLALIAVNFSTFETILQGFELAFNKRSEIVDIKREKIKELIDKKNTLEDEGEIENELDVEIIQIQRQISELSDEITKINVSKNTELAELGRQNNVSSPKAKNLEEQIKSENDKLKNLYQSKSNLELSLKDVWRKAPIKKQIDETQILINEKEKLINNLRNELTNSLANIETKNLPNRNRIIENAKINIDRINTQIEDITNNQLKPKLEAKNNAIFENQDLNNQEIELQKEIDELSQDLDKAARDNQIYRLALKIKYLFSDEDNKEFKLSAADLNQEDIDRAFWIWFGSLAFVISVIGTLIALAGLHLMDERMHEIRNQPINRKNTLKYRIGRFFVFLSKYFSTQIKLMIKPKTVEKIVEKEVEVEKIEEKIVYQDRIVHVDREVPKETIVKEMVYVPLPTDDAELLKRGPFKASDYDIKDKKK